jgi:3-oxoacyl-[acyl-carrier-protein] synthase III
MWLDAPGVRIADVETCDFSLMQELGTAELLHLARPASAGRYLQSPAARALIAELGVRRRHLTTIPGVRSGGMRLNAIDLGCSAVQRLRARRPAELERLDALIFVSTSNPNPCNSQAALLAERCGLSGSCMDLKAGCSGGLLGMLHGALLIRAGCERVLVVMAENLSQFTPPDDLRMLLSVGDGAACVLLESAPGPGFITMVHGTNAEFAGTMKVTTPFPPLTGDDHYVYEFGHPRDALEFQAATWRSVFRDVLAASDTSLAALTYACFHQTHHGQLRSLIADLALDDTRVPGVVEVYGNMGTPTVAVALARVHRALRPRDRFLLEAVGGGMSWCAIVAEHA